MSLSAVWLTCPCGWIELPIWGGERSVCVCAWRSGGRHWMTFSVNNACPSHAHQRHQRHQQPQSTTHTHTHTHYRYHSPPFGESSFTFQPLTQIFVGYFSLKVRWHQWTVHWTWLWKRAPNSTTAAHWYISSVCQKLKKLSMEVACTVMEDVDRCVCVCVCEHACAPVLLSACVRLGGCTCAPAYTHASSISLNVLLG